MTVEENKELRTLNSLNEGNKARKRDDSLWCCGNWVV